MYQKESKSVKEANLALNDFIQSKSNKENYSGKEYREMLINLRKEVNRQKTLLSACLKLSVDYLPVSVKEELSDLEYCSSTLPNRGSRVVKKAWLLLVAKMVADKYSDNLLASRGVKNISRSIQSLNIED